jgi:hypothetical protein
MGQRCRFPILGSNVDKILMFVEIEMQNVCLQIGLAERHILQGYFNYLRDQKIPLALLSLTNMVNSVPISTNKSQPRFLKMNWIVTSTQASLFMKNVAALMLIKLVGHHCMCLILCYTSIPSSWKTVTCWPHDIVLRHWSTATSSLFSIFKALFNANHLY